MTTFTSAAIFDLRLEHRFTDTELRQILLYVTKNCAPSDKRYFDTFLEPFGPYDLFERLVNACISVQLVAEAVDYGARKKVIADEIRAFYGTKQIPDSFRSSLSAHKFFNTSVELSNKVRNRMFVNPSPWMTELGVNSSDAHVARALGQNGMRDLFWKWLNAGHSMAEFIGVLNNTGEMVLANELGLGAYVTGKKTKSTYTNTSAQSSAIPTNAVSAFSGVDEDAAPQKELEPTLGELAQENTDKGFIKFCMELDEKRQWFDWLAAQNLTRGTAADKFVAKIDAEISNDPHYCAMLAVTRELCKMPAWRHMPRSDFIARAHKSDCAGIKKAAEDWSGHIASSLAPGETEAVDYDRAEFDIRGELRRFFARHSVFTGRNAGKKIEATIDKLTSDEVGVAELKDLKDVTRKEYREQFGFNISEARKMETAVERMSAH